MRNAGIHLLATLLAGPIAVMLIHEIGISRHAPAGRFPDGMIRGFYPADVRSCMGPPALAAIGEPVHREELAPSPEDFCLVTRR